MEQKTTTQGSTSSQMWERLEAFVCEHIPRFIHALLEEESTERLGRPKSARRAPVDASQGMRTGYGKPRRLRLTSGTLTVRRLRVRGLGERFVSRVLPVFQRPTREGGELLPQLSLHGLARLKAGWQLEYEAWKQRQLDDLEVVYVCADGLYSKAGVQDHKAALVVWSGSPRTRTAWSPSTSSRVNIGATCAPRT